VRTQVYLDERQRADLDRLSTERRVTVSELIRQAIDHYVGCLRSGIEGGIEGSVGLWRGRGDIGQVSTHVQRMRREWNKRDGRAGAYELLPDRYRCPHRPFAGN